jgi:hypothetical protein
MSFLDELLVGNAGATEIGAVAELVVDDVPTPAAGLKLFYDPSSAQLFYRHADNRVRPVAASNLSNVIHVCSHVPVGEVLTTDNFEYALNAALAHSRSLSYAPDVLLPAGVWPMTATVFVLPATSYYSSSPKLIGSGKGKTVMEWPAGFSGPCVHLKGRSGPYPNFIVRGGVHDLTIRTVDGYASAGILGQALLDCSFANLELSGFNRGDGWESGVGLYVDGDRTFGDGTWIENSQNCTIQNVWIGACMLAARFRAVGPLDVINFIANSGRGFADIVFDRGSMVNITSGMVQGGEPESDSASPYHQIRKRSIYIMGGSERDGVGACSLGASDGDFAVASGLSDMVPASVGRALYLRSGTLRSSRGIFIISEYLGPTSVRLEKASGGADSGLVWQEVATHGGSRVKIAGLTYHEGVGAEGRETIQSLIRSLRPEATSDWLHVEGVTPNNCDRVADLDGTFYAKIQDLPGNHPPVVVRARGVHVLECAGTQMPNPIAAPDAYDLDPISRDGFRYNGQKPMPIGRSLREILSNASAEILDPGDAAALSFSSGDVHSVTGVMGSVITAPGTGAVFIPAHPRMGGRPAIGLRNAGGGRALAGTFATPIPVGSYLGMFLIAHVPSGYIGALGITRGPAIQDAGGTFGMRVDIDAGEFTADKAGSVLPVDGGICVPQCPMNGRKTVAVLAHYLANSITSSFVPVVHVDRPDNLVSYGGVTPRACPVPITNIYLGAFPWVGGVTNDVDISFVAFFKRPLTNDEVAAAFAAADPYRVDVSPRQIAVHSGTFTVASVADGYERVNVASAPAVAQLRAGHRAGDRVKFKLTTVATNTLTIDPNGAETVDGAPNLVVSSDYGEASIMSDGTNWFTQKW